MSGQHGAGSGRTLILLHGLGGDPSHFISVQDSLPFPGVSKVIAPSMEQWFNDDSEQSFVDSIVSSLSSLISEQRGPVTLLGFSMGALLVGHYVASEHHARVLLVDSVILVAGPVMRTKPPAATAALRRLVRRARRCADQQQQQDCEQEAASIRAELNRLAGLAQHDAVCTAATVRSLRGGASVGYPRETAFDNVVNVNAGGAAAAAAAAAGGGCRMLVLHGSADLLVDCQTACEAIRGRYSRAQVQVGVGAGHALFAQRPRWFWSHVCHFIECLPRQSKMAKL